MSPLCRVSDRCILRHEHVLHDSLFFFYNRAAYSCSAERLVKEINQKSVFLIYACHEHISGSSIKQSIPLKTLSVQHVL